MDISTLESQLQTKFGDAGGRCDAPDLSIAVAVWKQFVATNRDWIVEFGIIIGDKKDKSGAYVYLYSKIPAGEKFVYPGVTLYSFYPEMLGLDGWEKIDSADAADDQSVFRDISNWELFRRASGVRFFEVFVDVDEVDDDLESEREE